MPPDPIPHSSASPHHPVSTPSPSLGNRGSAVNSGSPTSPTSPTSAHPIHGLNRDNATPPRAGPIGRLRQTSGSPATPRDTIPIARSPRRQRSSRFHVTERVELQRLPSFTGMSSTCGPCRSSAEVYMQRCRRQSDKSYSSKSSINAPWSSTSTMRRLSSRENKSSLRRCRKCSSGSQLSAGSSPKLCTQKSYLW
jgi:hypothetical protein